MSLARVKAPLAAQPAVPQPALPPGANVCEKFVSERFDN